MFYFIALRPFLTLHVIDSASPEHVCDQLVRVDLIQMTDSGTYVSSSLPGVIMKDSGENKRQRGDRQIRL